MCTHPTSNHHLSTADLTVIRQIHQHTAWLSTHLSQDLLTQTHHQNACISFTICTRSESSSKFLQHKKNDNFDCSWSSCPSPTSSTLLQHKPSYLSDAAKNPRHSRSSKLQSSFLLKSFYLFPKSSHSPRTPPTQLSEIYLFYLLPILYLVPQKLVFSLTDFWSFFSKGPLLLPEASPKRSVPIQSNPGSAVLPP